MIFLSLAAATTCCFAQPPKHPALENLHALSRRAGIIFTGRVTAIRRPEPSAALVEIEFAIETPIRGVPGPTYTLREWMPIGSAGPAALHVGARYLMLLHAPGASGLSSPVAGSGGIVPLGPGSESPGSPDSTDTADLRWLAAASPRDAADTSSEATASVVAHLRQWETTDAPR